jgi:hypothetical protein
MIENAIAQEIRCFLFTDPEVTRGDVHSFCEYLSYSYGYGPKVIQEKLCKSIYDLACSSPLKQEIAQTWSEKRLNETLKKIVPKILEDVFSGESWSLKHHETG